jgi:hypothetical protein
MGIGNSEAGLAGAVAASMGYVCVAADYLGLGESYILPPYLLAENSATSVIDMLRAGKNYMESNGIKTDGSLYLTGYAQGGQVSLATLNEIEQSYADEFTVTACAPLAGPFDLAGTIDTIMGWGKYQEPILFAYLMNSYDFYYEWDRLAEVFLEPYASEVPGYFDGSQLLGSLRTRLPQELASLLTGQFMADYASGGEEDFKKALEENSLLNFVPSAPIMLIHSQSDSTVPYFNSVNLFGYYQERGKTNVELTPIIGDHEPAAEAAILGAMTWFESLRGK